MENTKWPKVCASLTSEQQKINDDFMKYWHEILASSNSYSFIEKFNHGYVTKHIPENYVHTLEIGAGLGEHLLHENLTSIQKINYVALELRENMLTKLKERHPVITVLRGDCQERLPFNDEHFDRILAIHVLEHLPNLPAAVREMYRLCNKKHGCFSIVIPCEGGTMYTIARKISAQRIFERRYKQSYKWFIEKEHINKPNEIIEELEHYFYISHKQFFPFYVPNVNLNLCIGLTLKPKV